MKIGDYETHAAADVFPLLEGAEFEALCADVAEHGLREPITRVWVDDRDATRRALVLDGRNRLRACLRVGARPVWREYEGDDPIAFVVSTNLHRRHLNESQRAMVAARIATLHRGANQHVEISTPSQAAAAELVKVSRDSVIDARKVQQRGTPELARAVDEGRVAVSTAADVATLPLEEQREVVARGEREILAKAKEIRQHRTEERRAERMEKLTEISRGNLELGGIGTYPVLYADPPWRYEHAESVSREIENQYPTMELEDICAMGSKIPKVTTDDCVLFLWATSPKLAESLRVIESWGFTYRTCMVWDKERIGMGYYARQQHELLLIATKGLPPAPAPAARPPSVIRERRDEQHSAKPVRFYEIIEAMYPGLPKLELFCRSPRAGWAVWGNQSAA